MINVQSGARPEEIRQSARHVLFVEGKDDSAIDPQVLGILLRGIIRVVPLGACFHIRSAAEALFKHHPDYYFLVDRDHHDQAFVDKCWAEFPSPSVSNLLVWRRRELENYFLVPEYLGRSKYLAASIGVLKQTILACCRRRVFFDAANQVIVRIREEFKQSWVEQFQKVGEFRTREEAIARLTALPELESKKRCVAQQLRKRTITGLFTEVLEELTGGESSLQYGRGRWIELMRGKAILPSVVSKCFSVRDAAGATLQGPESVDELAKGLAREPMDVQPGDFQALEEMIRGRVSGGS